MKRQIRTLSLLWVILLLLCVGAVCVGRYPLPLPRLWASLLHPAEYPMEFRVLVQLRLPRILLTLLCGGALALSGTVYQSIFRNPLVSGDVLGVTQGCSVGAIAALLFGCSGVVVQLTAFVAGLATVFLCIRMAEFLKGDHMLHLILVGIVVGAIANAVIMMLKLSADPYRDLPSIEFWLMGSFSAARWRDVWLTILPIGAASTVLYLLRYQIYVLSHGEEEAKTLGIPVKTVRLTAIAASTVLISSVISAAGIVSWVGLIAPHAVRLLLKRPIHQSMVSTFVCGAILLLFSDTLARTLFSFELPISILTSIIGALFLWGLLMERRVKL